MIFIPSTFVESTQLSDEEIEQRTAQVAAEFRIGLRTVALWAATAAITIAGSMLAPWGVA